MQLCELQSRPVHTVTSGAGETYLTQNQNPGINKQGSALALSDSGEDLNLCPLHCSVGRAAATSPPPRAWAGTVPSTEGRAGAGSALRVSYSLFAAKRAPFPPDGETPNCTRNLWAGLQQVHPPSPARPRLQSPAAVRSLS